MRTILDKNGSERIYDEQGTRLSKGDVTPRSFSGFRLKKKKEQLINHVANGGSIVEFLRLSGVTYAQYVKWKSADIKFASAVELARVERANVVHEKFYENNIRQVADVSVSEFEDEEQENNFKKKLSLIKSVQGLLDKHKAQDAPRRFGSRVESDVMLGNVEIHANIPKDALDKIVNVYTPVVDKAGRIVVPNSNRNLTDVQDVEYHRVDGRSEKRDVHGHRRRDHRNGSSDRARKKSRRDGFKRRYAGKSEGDAT